MSVNQCDISFNNWYEKTIAVNVCLKNEYIIQSVFNCNEESIRYLIKNSKIPFDTYIWSDQFWYQFE